MASCPHVGTTGVFGDGYQGSTPGRVEGWALGRAGNRTVEVWSGKRKKATEEAIVPLGGRGPSHQRAAGKEVILGGRQTTASALPSVCTPLLFHLFHPSFTPPFSPFPNP